MKRIILLALACLVVIGGVSFAYNTAKLDRSQSNLQVETPVGGSDTIITMTEYDPVQAGQTNVDMVTVTNQYDRSVDITLTLDSSYDWTFSANGSTTLTFTLSSGGSKTVQVDLGGTGATCDSTSETTYYYTYEGTGTNTTLSQTQQDFIVCKA